MSSCSCYLGYQGRTGEHQRFSYPYYFMLYVQIFVTVHDNPSLADTALHARASLHHYQFLVI